MTIPAQTEPKRVPEGFVAEGRTARGLGIGGRGALTVAVLLAGLLAGLGWLYVLRGLGWFAFGPGVRDSLPLLQLAGFDLQPLGRVVVAWLAAGVVAGVALVRIPRPRRALLAGVLGIVLLLFASQASYALTRNLRLSDVVWSRHPGLGPWLEGLLFAVGCALPGTVSRGLGGPDGPGHGRGGEVSWLERVRDLRLRRREHGDA